MAQTGVITGTGETIPFLNPGATTLNPGDVVVLANIVGVVCGSPSTIWPIPATTGTGTLAVRGRFRFPKYSTNTFAAGAKCYWDATHVAVTSTSSGNTLMGVVLQAVVSGDASCEVLLNAGNLF